MKKNVWWLLIVCCLWTASIHAEPPAEGPTGDKPFRVGVEDDLRIFVWGEKDLSGNVRVRPDGRITVPLVNDIDVVGLSTDEIRDKIVSALGKYIRDPNVTVIVDSINSYRVYFIGEVRRQGALQFYRPTRLLQAIAAAGGLTEFAKKDITLLREQGGVEKRIPIDYKRLITGTVAQENIYVKPGDTLIFH